MTLQINAKMLPLLDENRDKIKRGVVFHSMSGRPLLTPFAVLNAMTADGEVQAVEPDAAQR